MVLLLALDGTGTCQPLEVVQQRPVQVTDDVDARVDRLGDGAQVAQQVGDPALVVDHPVVGGGVAVHAAVLGDHDGYARMVAVQPEQQVAQALRDHLPALVGPDRVAGRTDDPPREGVTGAGLRRRDDPAGVVVDAEVVAAATDQVRVAGPATRGRGHVVAPVCQRIVDIPAPGLAQRVADRPVRTAEVVYPAVQPWVGHRSPASAAGRGHAAVSPRRHSGR
jgi:hypothetical protein